MAALLDFVHLRRHALPAHLDFSCNRQPATTGTAPDIYRQDHRPRLAAAWHVGVDGRLACTWSAQPDDPA